MDTAGQIISNGEKVLYCFGTAKSPFTVGSYTMNDTYHIGINLNTGKIDDLKDGLPNILHLHLLTDEQQKVLVDYIPVFIKLKNKIVAITAKARSGKDTLGGHLTAYFSDTIKVALADPIRDVREAIYGHSKDKEREQLIQIGQSLRKGDPNIWIKAWLRKVIELQSDCNKDLKFICTDVRQPNEFTFFKSLGALTVKIEADEEKRLDKIREIDGDSALKESILNNETESYVKDFFADITIYNNYDESFHENIMDNIYSELYMRGW